MKTHSGTGLYQPETGRSVTDFGVVRGWVLKRDEWTCYVCGDPASQVDHVWPRRHGGSDHVDNLRAICPPCNQRKSDRVDIATASVIEVGAAIDASIGRVGAELRNLDRFLEAIAAKDDDGSSSLVAQCALILLSAELGLRQATLTAATETPTADGLPLGATVDDLREMDSLRYQNLRSAQEAYNRWRVQYDAWGPCVKRHRTIGDAVAAGDVPDFTA